MADDEPVAFFSYVRSDDEHDAGQISELRLRLEGELRMQTGRPFHIFQDRNNIRWGEKWKERIEDALSGVTFLVPILTLSYFRNPACRMEFETFVLRERTLGEERLILPIYYVSCEEMIEDSTNDMAKILKARNWADWRNFRFVAREAPELRKEMASLATTIKGAIKELEAVFAASKEGTSSPSAKAPSVGALVTPLRPTVPYRPEIPVVRRQRFIQKVLDKISKNPYYAYTTEFDEVISPSRISRPDDTMRLHSVLLGRIKSEISENEISINQFLHEIENAKKKEELAIIFLIDNSGSMHGGPIVGVACWTSMTANILSQVDIPNEVLGFTTRAWKGGMSREKWIQDGKPPRPGRLNDLRHIVYKSFDESFQEADTNFGVMLREGVLKENIDGEALLWAYSRFEKISAERKIIFVLSDGASVDDSTLSVNRGDFLQAHTIATVNWIKKETDVEIYGIGIETNVSQCYGVGSPMLSMRVGPEFLKVVFLAISRDWDKAGAVQIKSPQKAPRRPARSRAKT